MGILPGLVRLDLSIGGGLDGIDGEVVGVVSGCEKGKNIPPPPTSSPPPCTMPCTDACTDPCTAQLSRHHIPNPTPPNLWTPGLHDTAAKLFVLNTHLLIFQIFA